MRVRMAFSVKIILISGEIRAKDIDVDYIVASIVVRNTMWFTSLCICLFPLRHCTQYNEIGPQFVSRYKELLCTHMMLDTLI